jgi:hypothetical protein
MDTSLLKGYLMDMMNLPDDIQEEFMSGKFAVKAFPKI